MKIKVLGTPAEVALTAQSIKTMIEESGNHVWVTTETKKTGYDVQKVLIFRKA